jgi:hypothetical protein
MRILFSEGTVEKPGDNWEIATFVVGGEDYGVLVLLRCHLD